MEILEVTSVFSRGDAFAQADTNVDPPEYWGCIFTPNKEQRIYGQYGGCAIPFHECMFSLIGHHIPFNEFEMGVLNHLLIAPSQFHLVSWAFVNFFQHWYEYKGRKLIVTLFFHS